MDHSILTEGRPHLLPGVRFHDGGDHLVLEAVTDLDGIAGPSFADPAVHVSFPVDDQVDAGTELVGYGFAQFALPVRAVIGGAGFRFDPSPTLNSPPVVLPLVLRRPDGEVILAAPVDAWHEQVIAVVQGPGGVSELRWGWHGDLDRVPAGFRTTLRLVSGDGVAEVFGRWGAELRRRLGSRTRPVANPVVTRLSYWTGNGAAYWYRSEPGRDLATSVVDAVTGLRAAGVPVGPVELDSWFYPHEISREVRTIGYLDEVPPTGMLTWDARPDTLPEGVEGLAGRLGHPPLVLHARHISPASPYLDEGEWWVDLVAHPVDQGFFRRWFDDATRWGAVCIEQDWMLLVWFGVRQLRAEPGRAMAWLRALDTAGAGTGVALVWCMATPGDLLAAAELDQVVAVRTSDDYRYASDPAHLWHWYLTVNRLVGAVGVGAFKDCFLTAAPDGAGDPVDGDPHREVEALLAAFSAGIVGIGDRAGRTDPALVERLCRPDGVLVKPDAPLALADQSFFTPVGEDRGLCWATTGTGRWRYVVALHTADGDRALTDTFDLGHKYLVYDWRSGKAAPRTTIEVTLGHRDWALYVCCPVEHDRDGRFALIGDPTRLVTMGRQRVEVFPGGARGLRAEGEGPVALRWWRDGRGLFDRES